MRDLLHRPGFLGTEANLAADAALILLLLGAGLFTYGFYLARRKRYDTHAWVQTTAATLNLVLALWLMLLPYQSFVLQDEGGPRPTLFYVTTTAHAVIGAAAVLFGWYVILRGHGVVIPKAWRFNNYKPYMRTAYALYITATLLGVALYVVWYTIIPNPPLFE